MDHKLHMLNKRNHLFTKEMHLLAFIGTFAVSMLKNPSEFQNTAFLVHTGETVAS